MNRMKQHADKKRIDRNFELSDLMYVKLQPYKQSIVASKKCLKLSAIFFGIYKVLEKLGAMTY